MIWNILFWLGLALLIAWAIWRFLLSGRRKPSPEGGQAAPSPALRRLLPALAVVLLVISILVKQNVVTFGSKWTDEQKAELVHFSDAIDYYDQATALTTGRDVSNDDWETVNALLQASHSEAEQVSDDLLDNLHPELRKVYREEFVPGLSAGVYGLTQHTSFIRYRGDTAQYDFEDSLTRGRTLLAQWNDWFEDHRAAITEMIDQ